MHLDDPLLFIRIINLAILRVKGLDSGAEVLGLSVAFGWSRSTAVPSGEAFALLVLVVLIIIKV